MTGPATASPGGSAPSAARVSIGGLRAFSSAVLRRAGLGADVAELVADSLTDADARGVRSHGVVRLPIYARRVSAGIVDPDARPRVLGETASSLHLDAGNAIGQVGAKAGVEGAVGKAASAAVGVAGVTGSNHCGALGYWARRATDQGYAVIIASNAPPTMAYFGGRTRAVGANPFAIAVPRPDGPALVLDFSTSAAARGKVLLAAQQGRPIPQGWAIDRDGVPTTDAQAGYDGCVLPFAAHKGSGLAMMIDLLCGALLGGATGHDLGDMYDDWHRPQSVGHLFIALDPGGWAGRDAFGRHVERFVGYVHGLPPAAGVDRVLVPGDPEERALAAALADGVGLPGPTVAELDGIADAVGGDLPRPW